MGIFGPKGARLVFSCVSAVGATKFAPQADWDLQYSADALTAEELRSHRLTPASSLSTPAGEIMRRNKKNPNDIQVPIFYATNREPLSAAERQRHPRKFFGQVGKTSPGLNLGLGRVRIREDAFKLSNLQDERDARRLEEIAPCKDEAEWKKKLREALNGDVKKSIIVFVHGCFTDFPRGLEYGGLVKHGCNFSGPMVVFSWPSIGHKVQSRPYAKDEKCVKWTVPQLKEFLHMLLTEFEAKVHVLSYSMGARAVVGALDLLEEEVLALDDKLKKDGSHLKAALQDKLRSVVTRGEEAAAGMKVGVRELGNILARERDLLKEKAASLRGAPLNLNDGPDINPSGDLGYGQHREAGYGEGLPLTGDAGDEESPRSRGAVTSSGRAEERGLGLTTAKVKEGFSEERVKEWEALRAKLGHLIFMAPDEEVERFRHTARRWTQSLRNRVSGRTQGASEEVKERVRTDLEADGPQAVEEAAKRGGARPDDVIIAAKVAGLSAEIPRLMSSPAVLQGDDNHANERCVPPALHLALTSTSVSVTPRFSGWQNVLGSDGPESGKGAECEQEEDIPGKPVGDGAENVLMVSPSRLTTIFSGKALDLNPRNFVKPVGNLTTDLSQSLPHETASETPALLLPRTQSTPVIYPAGADAPPRSPSADVIPPSDDVFPPAADVISPGVSERAFPGYPRSFQGSFRPSSPSASSTSSRTPSRSSSSTDLVGEELQQALLWEHLHAAALDGYSDRSSDASSRASSRAPSRTPSLADLGSSHSSFNDPTQNGAPICGEESLSTAGDRHLTAGGDRVTLSGEVGVEEGTSGVTAGVSPEVTAGAGVATAGKPGEKALWRRKSLPAMALHLSSSAPVLAPGSLEWRFLHRPTAERNVSTSRPSPPASFDDVSASEDDVSATGPRFSLYTSQSDWALKLAGLATTKPWARGLARMVAFGDPGKNDLGRRVGAVLLVEEGYETIDATEVSIGSRNMGHHYLFHRCILEDITHLLSGANAHKRRFEATTPDGKVYWKIERGDYKPAAAPSPALYPTWSTVHMMESTKVAPAERQLLFFTSDEVAINFNY